MRVGQYGIIRAGHKGCMGDIVLRNYSDIISINNPNQTWLPSQDLSIELIDVEKIQIVLKRSENNVS